jgi:hypothetical protein
MPRASISPIGALRGHAVIAGTLLALTVPAAAQSTGPFAGMAGVWSGRGTVSLDNGQSERIRCRATYAVSADGTGMNQRLTCASDSYKFDLKSDVLAKGGKIVGSWSERSRNVSGNLSGRSTPGHFDVTVSAPTFTAQLTLATNGNKQHVTIRSEGAFRSANISLHRS